MHGAGGVTGGLLVQLVSYRGATVIATASAGSASRVAALGAATVLDHQQLNWHERIRALTRGGVDAAANAARSRAAQAMRAVRDRGRLAPITSDPPASERGITVRQVFVADGTRRAGLIRLLADGALTITVGERFPLRQSAAALIRVGHRTHGSAVVLRPDGAAQPAAQSPD